MNHCTNESMRNFQLKPTGSIASSLQMNLLQVRLLSTGTSHCLRTAQKLLKLNEVILHDGSMTCPPHDHSPANLTGLPSGTLMGSRRSGFLSQAM